MAKKSTKKNSTKRQRVSQTDIPAYPLEQAVRVAQAISENYASSPTKPLNVAAALNMAPNSSHFRQLTGAAVAYGLTNGAYNASEIALTDIGRRATKPLKEGDDASALREALLKPRILNEFLTRYNDSPLPPEKIAQNVLEDMGVPSDRTSQIFALIVESAKKYGLTKDIKGKTYIDLTSDLSSISPIDVDESLDDTDLEIDLPKGGDKLDDGASVLPPHNPGDARSRHVFITHGKNKAFIEPIKKLLAFGELTAVVSVDKQSVSKPVPEKVMDDMRACSAAIIHVDEETKMLDKDANEVIVINPNVLIEIGAAMALYGRRFILLVRDGVELPSNLQGLYEVRYSGDTLDGNATIKLLEAINDIKNNPIPKV
ncbi:TIR domain-containing protein [Hyphococcus sp.]|uniref:TIR domain-containing protein n=1 Tax=Hyphococcus sp. TaxID=2038636 RepID=UPI0035C71ADB